MKAAEALGARWTALALPALITFLAGIAVHCIFSFKPQLPESRFGISVTVCNKKNKESFPACMAGGKIWQ